MMFGVVVFGFELFVAELPGSGIAFWAILGGLTFVASKKMQELPEHS